MLFYLDLYLRSGLLKNLYVSKSVMVGFYKKLSSLLLAVLFIMPIIVLSLSRNCTDVNAEEAYTKVDVGVSIGSCFIDENFAGIIYERTLGHNIDNFSMDYKLTPKDVEAIKSLVFLNVDCMGIHDLTGIQNFEKLESLTCFENSLTSLQDLPNTLTYLRCANNQLTDLKNLPCELKVLDCSNNKLTSLSNLPNNIISLYCSNNELTSLNVTGCNHLKVLYCQTNKLSSIDANGLIELKRLYAYNNNLEFINISGCKKLSEFNIHNNNNNQIRISASECRCLCTIDNDEIFINNTKDLVLSPNFYNE